MGTDGLGRREYLELAVMPFLPDIDLEARTFAESVEEDAGTAEVARGFLSYFHEASVSYDEVSEIPWEDHSIGEILEDGQKYRFDLEGNTKAYLGADGSSIGVKVEGECRKEYFEDLQTILEHPRPVFYVQELVDSGDL